MEIVGGWVVVVGEGAGAAKNMLETVAAQHDKPATFYATRSAQQSSPAEKSPRLTSELSLLPSKSR